MGKNYIHISAKALSLLVFPALFLLFGAANSVSAQCTAGFSITSDTLCSDLSIQFTDTSSGSGTLSYLWDFGDAGSSSNFSNQQNPTHSFVDTGLLTVSLIITDDTNCNDTFQQTVYLRKSPVASFAHYDNCQNLSTKFTNTSTLPAGVTVSDVKWYFGTGDSAVAGHPQYLYSTAGSYQVQLIILTSTGCYDTADKTLTVYSKPQLTVSDTQFCAGTSIDFDVIISESSGVTYSWKFGDGNSSVQKSPLYTYNTGGGYHPQIKVTHGGTDSCFARFDSLTIYSLPVVKFSMADDTLCYTGNNACVIDSSASVPFGAGISGRTVVFGDGFIDNTTPFSTKTICHSYNDPSGGTYPVSIEVTDSNQCTATQQLANAVTVLPELSISFTQAEQKNCFNTLVTLTNTSTVDSTVAASFTWVYGDGNTDNTGWDTRTHLYTTTGNYSISLNVTDTAGCNHSFTSSTGVQSVVLAFTPTINKDTACFQNNLFLFTNPPSNASTATWSFGDGTADTGWSASHRYSAPGRYIVQLSVQGPNCSNSGLVDTITVLGPRARLGSPINRYQCLIHDTVYFTGSGLPYSSDHGPSPSNVVRLWDFADAFAPQCTTDTKNGINVGVNCNYSRDSMDVKHWYTPGEEGCYGAKIRLQDTVHGCIDTAVVSLALMPPKASPDLLAVPPVFGISFPKPDCLGPEGIKSKILFLNNTQPSCTRERIWVMWDSLCAQQSGNFNGNWMMNDSFHNFTYTNPPCDTGGRVTLGLIIRNGQDTAGQFCYDTAWYHDIFQFDDLYPEVIDDFTPAASRCPGTTVTFRVKDTTQTKILTYSWDFADGTGVVAGPNQKQATHTFSTHGDFLVTLTLTNSDGCVGSDTSHVIIGFGGALDADKYQICAGDTISFLDSIYYFDIGTARWNDTSRQNAGKESLRWDFGDGNGFVTTGNKPKVRFDKVGEYTVRLALKDSSGCIDTITLGAPIQVTGAYARLVLDDTIICPQLFQLNDSSRIYDPLNYTSIPTGDSIKKWTWTLGTNGPKSFLKDPYFDFASGGSYTIKLKVENTTGCTDSLTKTVFVKGPTPSFDFLSDTTGCSPLTVTFKNTSTNANKYTWHFRDGANNTITTLSDTDVYNVYTGGGTYKPFLTAESSEFDSKLGKLVTCKANFPDTASQTKRIVVVSPTPVAKFGNTNTCSSSTINFTDSTTITGGSISTRYWDFGDGDTSTQTNPVHTFADTGTYTIALIVNASSGCTDTFSKTITVAPPPGANFTVTNTCHGHLTQFTDSSITNNAQVVSWNWTLGDGSTSVFPSPTRFYALPLTYNVKLKILTSAGCTDSVTKSVTINPRPTVSYVAPNTCKDRVMTITNNSTITAPSQPLTYVWSFGNGNLSTLTNPTPVYTAYGNFTIKLIAESNQGCRDSLSKIITIHPLPVTSFFINDSGQCINENLFNFSNQTAIVSGTFTSAWNFGDATSASTTHTSHTYSNPGTYDVLLRATSDSGCQVDLTRKVYVYPKPTAGFTINDTAQCLNTNNFVFTNTSTDTGAMTYEWDFGDGGTDTLTHPSHTYNNDIFYTTELIATNGNACKDTTEETIHALHVPIPSFTINDTGQCVNNNQFIFTNTSAITSGTLSANWFFGDGATSTSTNASHTYSIDSTLGVRLVSTSNRGCSHDTTITVTVFPKPSPDFVANDSDQCVNKNTYQFSNQTTIKYGSNTYAWDFGDGNTSTNVHPTYIYAKDSNYQVKVVARSNFDCYDSITKQVTVFPKPSPSFTINDATQCRNTNQFDYTNTSTIKYGTLSYRWNFGNGKTSTEEDTSIVYTAYGQYTVKLVAESNFGCLDSTTEQIEVYPVPIPSYTINDSDQCRRGNLFQMVNASAIPGNGPLTYTWRWGNGDTSNVVQAAYTYPLDSSYNITLVATSAFGCKDSLIKPVIVYPQPQPAFAINDTGQCINGNQFDFTNQTTIKYGTLTYKWNFNNGKTSTATDTSIVYTAYGIYNPWLAAFSDQGCTDTITKSLRVYAKPIPVFTVNDSDQCLKGNLYDLNNQSSIGQGSFNNKWYFGNGDTSNVTQPDYTYSQDSTAYIIRLVLTSDFGCKDSVERQVTVFPQPQIAFSINDSGQCVNDNQFIFTNQSTVKYGTMTYGWDFGNSQTSTATDPGLVYAYDSIFRVVLKPTTNFGCTDTAGRYVVVHSKPNPDFTINDTGQCVNNNQFTFSNTSTIRKGSISSYAWDFGDGSTDILPSVSHIYTYDTGYTVQLIAVSDSGCRDTNTHTLTVFPKPAPNFTVNDSDQCVNTNAYQFFNGTTIKYGSNTYVWYFGDGNTSTTVHPNYQYSKDSNFMVKVVAKSNFDCYDSITKQVTVFPKPTPSFTINSPNQCRNINKYDYTGTSTVKYGTMTYLWYFGNGETSTQKDTSIVYTNHGPYTVKLVVKSNFDCLDSTTSPIEVYPVPVPVFAINDSDQCLRDNFYQMANTSSIPGNGPLTYKWRWGNGDTSNVAQASYSYPKDSTQYKIRLIATSAFGCKDSLEKPVIVYPQPVPAFAINDTGQCINGNKFDFTNQTTIKYGTLTYHWNFDNSQTDTSTNTSMVYGVYGVYNPWLAAFSDQGCTDTITKYLRVYAKPTPLFSVNDSDQCLTGNSYVINNQSNIAEGGVTYSWRFGNGDTSNVVQPVYVYPKDSTYKIKVVVTSNFGCKDSVTHQVVVFPQPQVAFVINDSGQCVNDNNFVFTNQSTVKYGTMTYNWDFGNSITATQKDTAVVYNYDSTFRVVLRATTNFGCTDTNGRYVIVHSKPNPDFSANDTDQCVNTNQFDFTNLSAINKGSMTYLWNFRNGFTDTAINPSTGYSKDTTYAVKLLAISDFNCLDSISKTMLVFPKPSAKYTVNDPTQCININSYKFSNQSTIKYGTLTYTWDFGNGDGSTSDTPVYVYPLQGTYPVTMYALSNNGCYDTAYGTSVLYPKPNPDFTINDSAQCLDSNSFTFTNTSTIDSGTFSNRWRMGDGREFITTDVTHKYNNPATYTAKLVLTSNFFCTDSVDKQVIVFPHPNPDFDGLKKYYCADNPVLPLFPVVPGGTFTGANMLTDSFAPIRLGRDTVQYKVAVNGCWSDTVKYTSVHPLPELNLPEDTTLCRREFLLFNISFPNSTYLWQDGHDGPTYKIIQPGQYKVTLYNLCDTLSQDINVTYLDYDCNFFFPSAFTPNGDGINDTFMPWLDDVEEMKLQVYTRWGELIFESTDKTKGWDGYYKGEMSPIGVYLWRIDLLLNEAGFRYTHSTAGTVTLVR